MFTVVACLTLAACVSERKVSIGPNQADGSDAGAERARHERGGSGGSGGNGHAAHGGAGSGGKSGTGGAGEVAEAGRAGSADTDHDADLDHGNGDPAENAGGAGSPADPSNDPVFRVESSTPANDTQLDDLSAPLAVQLTAALDRGSVAKSAVTARIVDAASSTDLSASVVVPVACSASEDGLVLSCSPENGSWHAGVTYRVELTNKLTSDGHALEPTVIRFNTRPPSWQADPQLIAMSLLMETFSGLHVSAAPSGEVFASWNISGRGTAPGSDYEVRRFDEGATTWSEVTAASNRTIEQLVALDGGTLLFYGHPSSPQNPGFPFVNCVDTSAAIHTLPISGGPYEQLEILGEPDHIQVLQSTGIAILGSCNATEISYTNSLPEQRRTGGTFNEDGSVVWTERDAADAGNGSQVLGIAAAGTGCESPACPTRLSSEGVIAELPALSWNMLLWREQTTTTSNVWSRSTRSAQLGPKDEWGPAVQLSGDADLVSEPRVAPKRKPTTPTRHTLAVWTEKSGEQATVYGVFHDGKTWSKAIALSEPFASPETLGAPAVVIDPSGAGMAAWRQYDNVFGRAAIQTVPFVRGQGWRIDERKELSYTRQVDDLPIDLTIDNAGHITLVWSEARAIWSNRAR
ncbi:MAG: hypothetical protein ABW321_30080 [Polyangiales bacterium]